VYGWLSKKSVVTKNYNWVTIGSQYGDKQQVTWRLASNSCLPIKELQVELFPAPILPSSTSTRSEGGVSRPYNIAGLLELVGLVGLVGLQHESLAPAW
jgi:hypothetical protein